MMPVLQDRLRLAASHVDALVHPDAARQAAARASHGAFIRGHLACGALALVLLPLLLAFNGITTPAAALSLGWLTAHLPLAMYVSRTGELARGQIASAVLFALSFGTLAALTGGAASPVLPLLVLAPVEAALTGRRRAVVLVAALTLALALALALGPSLAGLTLTDVPAEIGGFLPVSLAVAAVAVLYAGLLALRLGAALDRREAALLQREAWASTGARLAGEAMLRHGPGGRVEEVGEAAARLLALGSAAAAERELTGDGLFARIHVGDRPAYLKALSDTAAEGRPQHLRLRLRRGASRPGEAGRAAHAVVDMTFHPEPGGEAGLVSVLRDVTAEAALAAERDAALAEAEKAREAHSRFLAIVGHELRTPLNAILGFSDLLQSEAPNAAADDPLRVRDFAGTIHQSGSHLLHLVNDMLNMARIESGHFEIAAERFDLRTCLDTCRRMMEPEASRLGLRLSADLPLSLGEVQADPRACRQIALNLLSNALKFTPQGGRVVLFARHEPQGFVFGVRDTGIGIAPQDQERITEPFVQASSGLARLHDGAGLGLAVVKGLTSLSGGRMTLDSREGEGTCVSIALPAVPPAPQASRGTVEEAAGGVTGRATVTDRLAAARGEAGRGIGHDLKRSA